MSGGGQQPQGQQAKPLDIEWSFQGEHRLELTGLIRFPIQPVVIADLTNLQVSATGEKNGKIVTDNESLNKFFAGFGGVLSYADHYTHVDVLAVVGPKFNRVEANALYRLSEHAAVGGGYFLETKWFDSDTRVRAQGPFIEVVWAF